MNKILLFIFSIIIFSPIATLAVGMDEIDNLNNQMNTVADQTSTTLNKAKQLIKVATTTAGVAVDAYKKSEQVVSSTVGVVKRGTEVFNNLKSAGSKIGDYWNSVTNNSEPWRVAVVIGGIILGWIFFRFIL